VTLITPQLKYVLTRDFHEVKHSSSQSLLLQIATYFRLCIEVIGVEEKMSYIPEQTVIALVHITLKPNIQGSICGQDRYFPSQCHLFVTHFLIFQLLTTLTPPSLDVLTRFKCEIKPLPSSYFTKFTAGF